MEGGLNPPFPSIRSKQLQNGWERMGTEGTDGVNKSASDVLRALACHMHRLKVLLSLKPAPVMQAHCQTVLQLPQRGL